MSRTELDRAAGAAPHGTPLHRDAVRTLTRWRPPDPAQDSMRHAFLAYLAARPDACRRTCAAGHLTASTLLVSADATSVLLSLHPRIGRWVQLGGHCEDTDGSLLGAALREATEESGVADLRLDTDPLHLDVHPITCSLGVPTRHLDVRFLGHAPRGAEPVRSNESDDLRWWPVDALPAGKLGDPHIAELVRMARSRGSRGG